MFPGFVNGIPLAVLCNPALFQNPGGFEKNICRVFLDNCQLARYNKSDMDYSGPEFPGPGLSFITGVEAGVCVLRLVAFCRYKKPLSMVTAGPPGLPPASGCFCQPGNRLTRNAQFHMGTSRAPLQRLFYGRRCAEELWNGTNF